MKVKLSVVVLAIVAGLVMYEAYAAEDAAQPAAGAASKSKVVLKSDLDKASYVVGTQIGNVLQQQGLADKLDIVMVGIKDVLGKKELRLSEAEIKQAMEFLRKQVMEKRRLEAEENMVKGAAFLRKNKEQPGVKEMPNGLQYKVLKEGIGAVPKPTDKVRVHYRGTLVDGTEFDSSYKRNQPAEFGVGKVIPGWTQALQMMKVGAKWQLFIPADLAYGPQGRPGIPPHSALIFEVELLAIVQDLPEITPGGGAK